MSITFSCPYCRTHFQVTQQDAGETLSCRKCNASIPIPTDIPFEVKNAPSRISKGLIFVVMILFFAALKMAARNKPFFDQPTTTSNHHIDDRDIEKYLPKEMTVTLPVASKPIPASTKYEPIEGSDVKVAFVRNFDAGPSGVMEFRVYMPPGDHAAGSLPCVLVAATGANLLHGSRVNNGDYHGETLPYAEAGMIVIDYSTDGWISEEIAFGSHDAYVATLREAYLKSKAASAGVDNGGRAFDFAAANFPQIDHDNIYAAGHGSGGTLSLVLAANEPRISGCIAYSACYNLPHQLRELIGDPNGPKLFPEIKEFARANSPLRCGSQIQCPIFLFHAEDDAEIAIGQMEEFAEKMKDLGKDVTSETSEKGGHLFPIWEHGIPRAVAWIKARSQSANTEPDPKPPTDDE